METHQASAIKLQKTIRGFIVRKKLIASIPSYSQLRWKNFRLVRYPQLLTEHNKIIENFAYNEKYANSGLRPINKTEKNSSNINFHSSIEFEKVEKYETSVFVPLEKPGLSGLTLLSVKLREKWVSDTEELKEGKKRYVIQVDTGPEIKEFKGVVKTLTGCLEVKIVSRKEFKVNRQKPLCELCFEEVKVCVEKSEGVETENRIKKCDEEGVGNVFGSKHEDEEKNWRNVGGGNGEHAHKKVKSPELKRIVELNRIAQETNEKVKERQEKIPPRFSITPEKHNKTPERLNKTPERPNKTPERPNKTPERPNKTPERPNKTPETLKKHKESSEKTAERVQKTPKKHKKTAEPSNQPPKLAKSEMGHYKNPESRKSNHSSIDSKKRSKKTLKNLPINPDSSSSSGSQSEKQSTKNFKIRVHLDPPYSSSSHLKTQKLDLQRPNNKEINIKSQEESKIKIKAFKKPKSKFFPYEKNSQILPLIYSQKHGFSNYKDYGFISDLNSHRPGHKNKAKEVQGRIWSCKSEQKFVPLEKKLPKFSPYNSKMIEKQYAEHFCLSKNDQMQNRKSANFVVNERIKQLYGN